MGERETRNHIDDHFGKLFGNKGDHPIRLGNTMWDINSDHLQLESAS